MVSQEMLQYDEMDYHRDEDEVDLPLQAPLLLCSQRLEAFGVRQEQRRLIHVLGVTIGDNRFRVDMLLV